MDDLSLPGQRRDNLFPAGMQGFYSKQKTLLAWMQSPAGKTQIAEAEKDAWIPFNQQFPNADKSKFVSQASVESKGNVSAEIFFKASDDLLQSVFGSDRKYWSAGMKQALGLGDGRFSLPAVAAWLESFFANPCGSLRWQSAKLEENIQRRNQNIRHTLPTFHNKIQRNIPKNQTQAYFWNRIKTLVRRT